MKQRLVEVQNATYDDMCRVLDEKGMCNVDRPCGTGKTTIFLRYVDTHAGMFLYFYDTNSVRDKVAKATDRGKVQLMSYARLYRSSIDYIIQCLNTYNITCMIFDESHRIGAKTVKTKWRPLVEYCVDNGIKVIGGTATDLRTDGTEITKDFFGECSVFPYTLADAIDDRLLLLPWYIAADLEPIREDLLEWASEEDKRVIMEPENLEDLVSYSLQTISHNKSYIKLIVFYSSIKEIDETGICEWKRVFRKLRPGYKVNVIPITSKHQYNMEKLDECVERENAVDVFLSVDMLDEGFHFSDLTGIVMYRKTQSPIKYIQQIGRCMSVDNENDMFVLDLVGNFMNEFTVKNPLAGLYRNISGSESGLCTDNRGISWREEERLKIKMSARQMRERDIKEKLMYALEASTCKILSTVRTIYKLHPEYDLREVSKAMKINLGTIMLDIAVHGLLREEDYVPEVDPMSVHSYKQRLTDKYCENRDE